MAKIFAPSFLSFTFSFIKIRAICVIPIQTKVLRHFEKILYNEHMAQQNVTLQKIDEYRWHIPKNYMKGMRVDGIVYANEKLLGNAKSDEALQQVANVAHPPGIVKYSLAMPDLHWGYGFVIGGVAATDPQADGVVSPGGIGYDINCGVRLIRTNLDVSQLDGKRKALVGKLFENVPCGVGSSGIVMGKMNSANPWRVGLFL